MYTVEKWITVCVSKHRGAVFDKCFVLAFECAHVD